MKIIRTLFVTIIVASLPDSVATVQRVEVEIPSIFGWDFNERHCENNGVVASWCDETIQPTLKCALNPDFNEYGCSCRANPALCPTECIGGVASQDRTHFEILCVGIPTDEPNYILKEGLLPNSHHEHCENNAVVASWCDEFVNPDLKCGLLPIADEYVCSCYGNPAACPTDCVGGTQPLSRGNNFPKFEVHCQGIPIDQPNYELKGGPREAVA